MIKIQDYWKNNQFTFVITIGLSLALIFVFFFLVLIPWIVTITKVIFSYVSAIFDCDESNGDDDDGITITTRKKYD